MTSHKRPFMLAFVAAGLLVSGLFATGLVAADGGTWSVEVPDNTTSKTITTSGGAIVTYIGDGDVSLGSAGTGTFNSFVRVQASPVESGYNTNGTLEPDTKSGTWTHAIKVSDIPVVTIGGQNYWELFSDINDGNNATHIQLTDLEVWFTTNANLTGYPFGSAPAGDNVQKVYDFAGQILINDVNQGSGRGDLRYRIPLTGIPIPSNCGYFNAACNTYFLLYNKWGESPTGTYSSDGGFEEWKVKQYPTLQIVKNTVGGDGTFDYTVTGSPTPPPVTNPSITTSGGTGSTQTYIIDPGTYTIDENGPPSGWGLQGAVCSFNGDPATAYTEGSNIVIGETDHVVCTFTNVKDATVTIIKDAVPNDAQDFAFTTTGTGLSGFSLDDDADATLSNTKVFTISGANFGAKTVTETLPVTGWTLTNLVCSDGTVDIATGVASFTVDPGDAITCTYTNTKNAKVTIVKDAVPNDPQDFAFTTSGTGLSGFSLDDDADATLSNTKVFNFLGTNYGAKTVTETLPVAGWSLTNLVCSEGTVDLATGVASFTVDPGDDITCTYTNKKDATVTIVKDAVPNDPQDFAFTTTGAGLSSFSLDDDADATLSNTKVFTFHGTNYGAKTVTETLPVAGWSLTNLVCSEGTVDLATGVASFTVDPGDSITCTYTNTKAATVTIIKDAVPNDAQDFAYTTTGTGMGAFSLDDDADATLSNTKVFTFAGTNYGAKTVTETLPVTGWSLTNLVCSEGTVDLATGVASFTVDPGDAITCTYTNTKDATVTIIKDAVPNDAQDFGYTTTGTGMGAFSLDDDADATLSNTRVFTFHGTNYGAKTVTETLPVAGWTLTNLVCSEGTVDIPTGVATFTVDPGDEITCTYTNTKNAKVTIVKDAVPNSAQDFAYTTTGTGLSGFSLDDDADATLSNTKVFNFLGTNYGAKTVTETLPVAGWALTSLVCSEGTVDLATGQASFTVDPGDDITCTYTNKMLPTIIVRKISTGSVGAFGFTTTGGNGFTTPFTLTTLTENVAVQQSFLISAGGIGADFTVSEGITAGFVLTDVSCVVTTAGAGGTTVGADVGTRTASINDLAAGATVTCTFINSGAQTTRTQGFWATHSWLVSIVWSPDPGTAGGISLDGMTAEERTLCGSELTVEQVMGGFWANIAKESDGTKRTKLDQARMQLLQQLLAAILNNQTFGSSPSGAISIQDAKDAFCSGTLAEVQAAMSAMAAFNTGGDSGVFTPGGSADAKYARSIADIEFWDVLP